MKGLKFRFSKKLVFILMGSIDLSVEGVVALSAVIASLLVANDVNSMSLGLLAVPLATRVGAIMGFMNGYLHIRLKTPFRRVSL